jgi:dipeptidyl aminopeptidase/acylaminoacyl peptidase
MMNTKWRWGGAGENGGVLARQAVLGVAALAMVLGLAGASALAQVAPANVKRPVDAKPPATAQASADHEAFVHRLASVGRAFLPSFSPDGSQIALISDMSGVPQVWIVPTRGGWPRRITTQSDPVGSVQWSPKGDWLAYTVLPGGGLNSQIYVVRSDGSGVRRLTDGGKDNNWLGEWTDDGRFLTIASNRRRAETMDAYLLEPTTARLEVLADLQGVGNATSRDGRRVLLSRLKHRGDNDLYLLDRTTGKEARLTPHQPPGSFTGTLAPDGKVAYLSSNKDRDLMAFARVDIGAAPPGPIEILAERADAELDDFALDHRGKEAAITWNVSGKSELAFIDLATGKTRAGPRLPAEICLDTVYAPNDESLAITCLGATAPLDVHVLDLASGRFRQVTQSSHPGVDLATLTRPELVRYAAHDGLSLSAWLYRPKAVKGKAPFVLSFHGGPEGQERPTFRSDYQALLARGIGVLAPNVRGSSGFGKRYANLDNGERRFGAIADIKASADYLLREGLAAPGRLGIMGGSYGGYMTMAGLTHYPDLFAAGVNLFGIVNFKTFFAQSEPWMGAISTIEYGHPTEQAELLDRLSPIHSLDRIQAALMVQHGQNDTNVPIVEAEQIVAVMKKRGRPVEYVMFPDEGHGFRKVDNRVRSVVEVVAFFEKHLKTAGRR